MRILPFDEHQSRKEKILQAVVHLYIKTGKPVGSSTILDQFQLNLSPATVRNVMADLEHEGFLSHPHTSAGRVPTDKGYRAYVNSLIHIQKLAVEEEAKIRHEYSRRMKEIEDLMQSTSRVLSLMSHCTGFALPSGITEERFRHIELIAVSATQVLGVLIAESGTIQNQMIDVRHVPSEEVLRSASRYLNEKLSGLALPEAQSRMATELLNYQESLNNQREIMEAVVTSLLDSTARPDVYVEGAGNILKFPEFQDFESMRSFAQLVDEKEALGIALTKELAQGGLQVKIGNENVPALRHFSVVSHSYQVRGRPMGVIGILGPKRMDYDRMIAIVNSVSDLVNSYLEENTLKLSQGIEDA